MNEQKGATVTITHSDSQPWFSRRAALTVNSLGTSGRHKWACVCCYALGLGWFKVELSLGGDVLVPPAAAPDRWGRSPEPEWSLPVRRLAFRNISFSMSLVLVTFWFWFGQWGLQNSDSDQILQICSGHLSPGVLYVTWPSSLSIIQYHQFICRWILGIGFWVVLSGSYIEW